MRVGPWLTLKGRKVILTINCVTEGVADDLYDRMTKQLMEGELRITITGKEQEKPVGDIE